MSDSTLGHFVIVSFAIKCSTEGEGTLINEKLRPKNNHTSKKKEKENTSCPVTKN